MKLIKMKQTCKQCGKNCEGEYCFQHKPRKALRKTSFIEKIKDYQYSYMDSVIKINALLEKEGKNYMYERDEFFLSIWKKRPHKCENCNVNLGKKPLSYMFDHILEKEKYPELKLEEDDIWLLCLECHDNKTRSNLSDKMKEKIKITKEIFDI